MKLLFDQNISYKIIKLLSEAFPDSIHVSAARLSNASDEEIWSYAREKGYAIDSFDADFLNLLTLKGYPPKIIRLTAGNMTTRQIASLLLQNQDQINSFLSEAANEDFGLLEISK